MVVVADMQSKLIYVNDTYRHSFAPTGQPLGTLTDGIHPDDQLKCRHAIAGCLAGKPVDSLDLRKDDGQGVYLWSCWDISLLHDLDGNAVGIIYLGHDLTEQVAHYNQLKHSEMVLRSILDSTADSHILIAPDFSIISINRVAIRSIRTLHKVEAKLGDDFRRFLPQDGGKEFDLHFKQALAGHITQKEFELETPHLGPNWREVTFYPVSDPSGVTIGVALRSRNITSQKKAELDVQRHNVDMARVNRALREISWIQSHRVRAPLASILGLVQIIGMEKDLSEQQFLLHLLKKSAHDLDEVIHDVVESANRVEEATAMEVEHIELKEQEDGWF